MGGERKFTLHSEDVATTAPHLRIISRVHFALQAVHKESERLLFPIRLNFCHWNDAYHVALETKEKLNHRKQFNKIKRIFDQIEETFTFLNVLTNTASHMQSFLLLFLQSLATGSFDLNVEVKHNNKAEFFFISYIRFNAAFLQKYLSTNIQSKEKPLDSWGMQNSKRLLEGQ